MRYDFIPVDMKHGRIKKWFKSLGVAGFLFFLVKGLVWLVV